MLYVVSTPIGNLKDITFRAVDTLRAVDIIVCEDTRRTGILLKHYDILGKELLSFNDYNKRSRTKHIINILKNGNDVAFVSDSGTPAISDPGFYLVRECVKEGIKLSSVPGPNAALSALVCSGLPTDKFVFLGFLPKKEKKLKELILEYDETIVCYESPHRVEKTLKWLNEVIPDKNIVIARELTKKFEEFIRGKVSDVYAKKKTIKGEIVLVIN